MKNAWLLSERSSIFHTVNTVNNSTCESSHLGCECSHSSYISGKTCSCTLFCLWWVMMDLICSYLPTCWTFLHHWTQLHQTNIKSCICVWKKRAVFKSFTKPRLCVCGEYSMFFSMFSSERIQTMTSSLTWWSTWTLICTLGLNADPVSTCALMISLYHTASLCHHHKQQQHLYVHHALCMEALKDK